MVPSPASGVSLKASSVHSVDMMICALFYQVRVTKSEVLNRFCIFLFPFFRGRKCGSKSVEKPPFIRDRSTCSTRWHMCVRFLLRRVWSSPFFFARLPDHHHHHHHHRGRFEPSSSSSREGGKDGRHNWKGGGGGSHPSRGLSSNKKNSKSQNIPLFSLDVKYVGWRKSTHTRTHTHTKKKTHRQTLNPNKKSPFFVVSLLHHHLALCSRSSRALFFGANKREREREREREKGLLYDDDVNDDEYVLRDDDDDAKNRPAIYAPRADDASSQSAPEVYSGGMAAAPFDDDASSPSSSSSASSSSQYWTRTEKPAAEDAGENNRTKTKMSGPGSTSSDVGEHSSNAGSKHVSSFLSWPTRTTSCGALNASFVGEKVSLCGWVDKQRDMGGICFADVRDHSGLVQIVGAGAEGVHANQKQIDEILSSLALGVRGESRRYRSRTEQQK